MARALIKLCEMPDGALGPVRAINLPGLSVTVEEMISSMERRARPGARDLISWKFDVYLQGLLDAMPKSFTSARAVSGGIIPESRFDVVIADFMSTIRV